MGIHYTTYTTMQTWCIENVSRLFCWTHSRSHRILHTEKRKQLNLLVHFPIICDTFETYRQKYGQWQMLEVRTKSSHFFSPKSTELTMRERKTSQRYFKMKTSMSVEPLKSAMLRIIMFGVKKICINLKQWFPKLGWLLSSESYN